MTANKNKMFLLQMGKGNRSKSHVMILESDSDEMKINDKNTISMLSTLIIYDLMVMGDERDLVLGKTSMWI